MPRILPCLLLMPLALPYALAQGGEAPATGSPYAQWENGPPSDPSWFPIAVWLQSPSNASRYRDAGINLYIGLWEGPTEEQLAALEEAGMPVICDQNAVGLAHLDDPIIVGWMHGDEPDNAQALPGGGGYGPPILPETIISDWERLRAADPSRPVLLNLGQGVAWDGWYGRGERTNHPEDYPEYVRGGDIVSFDIYPVVHDSPEVAGRLGYVPYGVDRLRAWAGPERVVWNCIECTRIGNIDVIPTPHQVRSEVWLSLIHGSQGLIYFVHQFAPSFCEWALLEDAPMLAAVTRLNARIASLAPALNSPPVEGFAEVSSADAAVPIDCTVRKQDGATYLFAAANGDAATVATFRLREVAEGTEIEVLDEDRVLHVEDGSFRDEFEPWGVHLYRVP